MIFTTSSRMFLSETSFLFLSLSMWKWRIQVPPSNKTKKQTKPTGGVKGLQTFVRASLRLVLSQTGEGRWGEKDQNFFISMFYLSQYICSSNLAPILKDNLESRKRHFKAKLKFYWASSEENLNVHLMNRGKLYNKGPYPLYIPLFYPGSLFSNNHYPKSAKFILFYSVSQRFWKAFFL